MNINKLAGIIVFSFLSIFSLSQQTIEVCYQSDTTISFTDTLTGNNYLWETRESGSSTWILAKDWSPDKFLELNSLVSPIEVRYLRDENNNQIAEDTVNIANVNVFNPLSRSILNHNQSICYNDNPDTIFVQLAPTGGSGNFSYQWQILNGIWTDIPGATDSFYQPTNLIENTYYRLQNLCLAGCGVVYSDTANIQVFAQLNGGTIEGDQSICYSTIPTPILLTVPAMGGGDGFSNQWEVYNNGIWVEISGQNSDTLILSSLILISEYRMKSTSTNGCGIVYSNIAAINVYDEFVPGQITGNQTICYNTTPSLLSFAANPSGASGNYHFQWQESQDGIYFTDILGATLSTFQEGNLQTTSYYRTIVTDSLCGSRDSSNIVIVNVNTEFLPGLISDNQSICYNSIPDQLQSTNCSGGGSNYFYQWEKSLDGIIFTNATGSGFASLNYNSDVLTQSTFFRMKYTSSNGCGSAYSNLIHIEVYSDLSGATIGNSQTICFNTSPNSLNVISLAAGGGESFSNQWEVFNGINWNSISGEQANSYQPGSLTSSKLYRLNSTSNYGCGSVFSNTIQISVYSQIHSGQITADQTICYDTQPGVFSFSLNPSGEDGLYHFEWQQSLDGSLFTTILGANSNTFQETLLQSTHYYRAVITSLTCGTADTTNFVTVSVYNQFLPGIATGDQAICYNTVPSQLIATNASGAGSLFSYQWEKSQNGTTYLPATGIGVTSLNFTSTALIESTYFRIKYSSVNGCGVKYSNSVYLTVYPDIIGSTIGNNQTICFNTSPYPLILINPATGGNGLFSNQWQVFNGSSWSDITGEQSDSLHEGLLVNSMSYRVKSTSNYGCGSIFSNSITITVYEELNAGQILANQTICYSTQPEVFSYSLLPNGEDGIYEFQWQNSQNGTNFSDIPSALFPTYQAGTLSNSEYYRIIVSSPTCGTFDTSNIIEISVLPEFFAGAIEGEQTICSESTPTSLSVNAACSGGDGNYIYQWQSSIDGITFYDILSATNEIFQPSPLTQTTYYRLEFKNCDTLHSNIQEITVNPLPIEKSLIGDQVVCRNQNDVEYKFSPAESSINYHWTIEGGIIKSEDDEDQVIIHWDSLQGIGIITLLQSNNLTGCLLETKFDIEKTADFAPNKTRIIVKGNSNILICEDERSGASYEWGFINLQSKEETLLQNSDYQYIQYPHTIDTTRYKYFVAIDYDDGLCKTRTFYPQDMHIFNHGEVPNQKMLIYPIPAKSNLSIKLNQEIPGAFKVIIVNQLGQSIYFKEFRSYQKDETLNLSLDLPQDLYILLLNTDQEVITSKIIIE